MSDVKRYRVSYMNGVIEEDGSPRSFHDSEPMVLASDYAHLQRRCEEMASALRDCEDYFDDRADVVDGSYGEPAPNTEMHLLTTVREALGKAS